MVRSFIVAALFLIFLAGCITGAGGETVIDPDIAEPLGDLADAGAVVAGLLIPPPWNVIIPGILAVAKAALGIMTESQQ